MIGKTIGHYDISEELGTGGMGVVYRATDRLLRRDVALKFLPENFADDPDRRARLVYEARALASVNHPNIAAIYGLEEVEERYALVMEYVDGTTLSERIRKGAMEPKEMFPIALQMCAALAAAHKKGIIHRDVKPSNVKVTPDGRVKVLDFGLALAKRGEAGLWSSDDTTVDLSGITSMVAGTVAYMAPEQLQGTGVDERSDIYAMGVVLYELAVGQRPFADADGASLIRDILDTPPAPPRWTVPSLPVRLEAIILKCLEKEPALRHPSMRALREELRLAACDVEAPEKSIAVLYFENAGGAPEDDFLCDGITEDILVELSRIQGLTVLSRSAMLRFRRGGLPATDVGRKLGAMYVLHGSVRRAGSRLRLTTELVETRSGRSLWAERYDRQLEDVFAIQEEIAKSITQTLRVVLSDAEKRVMAKAPTANVEAYECYLRGRQYFRQFRRKSIEFAIQMIGRAIELDARYALAHAALADCYSYLYMFWEASQEHLSAADRASLRAVTLDPELAEAHVARGVARSLAKRYVEADREFETAVRLNPRLFEAYYFCARGYYARGLFEQAVSWFERAMQARPEDYQAPTLLSSALAGLERQTEADEANRRALRLAQQHLEIDPGDTRALYFSAIALCHLGEEPERALQLAERALAMDPAEPQVLYNVGCVYALLGFPDKALHYLEATIAHGDWWRTWMRNDPDLVSLNGDARFQHLVGEEAE